MYKLNHKRKSLLYLLSFVSLSCYTNLKLNDNFLYSSHPHNPLRFHIFFNCMFSSFEYKNTPLSNRRFLFFNLPILRGAYDSNMVLW